MPRQPVTNHEQEKKAQGSKPSPHQPGSTGLSRSIELAAVQYARHDPTQLSSAQMIHLQRTIGNRAVTRLLPMAKPPQPAPNYSSAHIQRTIWRYSGGKWNIETPKSLTDTDEKENADDYCKTNGITPEEFDKYDQNTGTYYSWRAAKEKTEKRAKAKKRPKNYGGGIFDEGREMTPYGPFKPRKPEESRNKNIQGPHLLAHVTKRTVFDLAEQMGLIPQTILGSKVAPKPRQALKMMQDMLTKRGLPHKNGALYLWYREYKSAYLGADPVKRGSKKKLKQLMELHPLTTYRVGEEASPSELAGKGEKGEAALQDISSLLAASRSGGIPDGLTTVDSGFENEGWSEGDSLRQDFIFNYAYLAMGRPPSPSPYDEAPMSPVRDDDW